MYMREESTKNRSPLIPTPPLRVSNFLLLSKYNSTAPLAIALIFVSGVLSVAAFLNSQLTPLP